MDMTLKEALQLFKSQSDYCRENNTLEGLGCDGCTGKDETFCADAIVNMLPHIK